LRVIEYTDFRTGILNLIRTWSHIYPLLSTRGPQDYKWGQFVEKLLHIILVNATEICIWLRIGLQTINFLQLSLFIQILETTFASENFQYQVYRNVMVKWLALLLLIWEVADSNLDPETGYTD
jgi:hypothetical protein